MAIIIIIIIIIGTALHAWYAEKGLCNGTVSVVCLSRGSSEKQLCHSPVAGNWAAAARRSAANAGSAMFTAEGRGWTQTCYGLISR